ncbi:MAG: glycosyltransferase family 4 protein, partial [Pseudomonadota bacterium]
LQDQDIRLTIVGAGPDADALKAAAAPLGDKVHFTGALNQEEVAQTLAGADVFVLPSFAEGVPVVLMEALVAGLPVIATRVAGVQELVEDGVSGFVVPPGDVEALTQAIKAYAAMPDQGRAMAARGRETVLAEFDISAEAARLARLIEDGPGEVIRPEAATPKLTEGTL